eukprot:3411782-Prymnesium_polylepis.1
MKWAVHSPLAWELGAKFARPPQSTAPNPLPRRAIRVGWLVGGLIYALRPPEVGWLAGYSAHCDVLHVDKGRDPTRPLVRPH